MPLFFYAYFLKSIGTATEDSQRKTTQNNRLMNNA